jgi:rod shape determining protein RodA
MSERFKNKIADFPYIVFVTILMLCLLSIFMMFIAGGGDFYPFANKQIIFSLIFIPLMLLIIFIDLKLIFSFSYIIYILSLLLLILVEVFGHKAMGATRWINLGFFKMQPSELMKIALVLAIAKYFHVIGEEKEIRFKTIFIPLILILLPSLVIMKQPDLGTATILILVGSVLLFLAGTKIWKFIAVGVGAIAAAPILWTYLHDYQKKRIEIFLNPGLDPLNSGYNIIQSKIAIGSGGFIGKGILSGTQAQLNFLPEHQTDFVFPMFAEEFGYVGSIILLMVYAFLMLFGIKVANHCKYIYGRLCAFGLISIFTFHVFINIGMVMGLLPAVGIPLPFMSYGGTILGTTLFIFGIIINIYINKKVTLPKADVNYFF